MNLREGLVPSRVQIFDINGRMVAEIAANNSVGDAYMRPAGGMYAAPTNREYIWTPEKSLGSGVYLVRAKIGDKEITKRVVYLK
ncbi:T9SS type A sorting domain-containing protein [bacterium]|nr:T9SS type A sorting domain-containing protein [bacterium]